MSKVLTSERFMDVGQDGYVTADDVLVLRDTVYRDGITSKQELNSLLGLAERAPDGDIEWAEFFGEAAADYYLREEIPHDYITERTFNDLHAEVTRYGDTVTPLVLSMMIKLVRGATATPPGMSAFITDQLRAMIDQRAGEPAITQNDTALIRSFLYATGSDGNIAITRKEAGFLFDLNDMALCSANHASWSDLFIKAIASHVMGHIGYVAPSRKEALAQWHWVSDTEVNIAGFFQRMVADGLAPLRDLYAHANDAMRAPSENTYEQILKTREQMASDAAGVTDHEADWLAERIGRDGIMDDNERAVIAYMRALDMVLPETLQALVEHAA